MNTMPMQKGKEPRTIRPPLAPVIGRLRLRRRAYMCSNAGVYIPQLYYELIQLLHNAGLACRQT